MCGTYLKSGDYESTVPKSFKTSYQGNDKDEKVDIEEEYCYICEKLINDNDKVFPFSGTDFVACSSHCYNQGRGNGKKFHQCSSCVRQIPESIGKTCRTCQNQNRKPKPDKKNNDDTGGNLHTCPQCRSRKP
jgi:hypothetical protein